MAADTEIKGTGITSATASLDVQNSAGTSLLYARNDGNVGIGTTVPVHKLHVINSTNSIGAGVFYDSSAASGYGVIARSDNGTPLLVQGASGASLVTFQSGGNVGIGTTGPGATLDVQGTLSAASGTEYGIKLRPTINQSGSAGYRLLDISANVTGTGSAMSYLLYITDPTYGNYFRVRADGIAQGARWDGNVAAGHIGVNERWDSGIATFLKSGSTTEKTVVMQMANFQTADILQWQSHDYTVMGVIAASGNVGIGTTAPGAKLHIYNAPTAGSGVSMINLENPTANSNTALRIGESFGTPDKSGYWIYFNSSWSNPPYTYQKANSMFFQTGAGATNGFGFATLGASAPISFYNTISGTVTSVMEIINGNVGIGTTGPTGKLEVAGEIIISSAPGLRLANSYTTGNQVLNIDQGTNVWNVGATVYGQTTSATNDIAFRLGNASGRFEAVRITSAGNVGIGTTAPSSPLHVNSSVSGNWTTFIENTHASNGYGLAVRAGDDNNVKTLELLDVNSSILFYVKSAGETYIKGNVGIGTTSPGGKLEVAGQYFSTKYALTDGVTIALDWANGNVQSVTLGGNRTFTFANPKSGAVYTLILTQDATGSRTVTWPATAKWPGGVAPVLTTTASAVDILTFVSDGTNCYNIGFAADVK